VLIRFLKVALARVAAFFGGAPAPLQG
jgi:hypothetical protein